MRKPAVYDFIDLSSLLRAWFAWLKAEDPKFSLRWLAKRLELKSHAHLLRLAKGDKNPTDNLVRKLAAFFDLTVDEYAYLRLLGALSRARANEERQFLLEKLEEIRQRAPDVLLQLDAFELIAH